MGGHACTHMIALVQGGKWASNKICKLRLVQLAQCEMKMMVDRMAQVLTRFIWRVLVPLLDMGYQVDVRIMNSVHYAVPQRREVSPNLHVHKCTYLGTISLGLQGAIPDAVGSSAKPIALHGLSTLQSCLQRLIIYAAKAGYKLPSPPIPW